MKKLLALATLALAAVISTAAMGKLPLTNSDSLPPPDCNIVPIPCEDHAHQSVVDSAHVDHK